MLYTLSLTDADGILLEQWTLGDSGYPLPLHKLDVQDIVADINRNIKFDVEQKNQETE